MGQDHSAIAREDTPRTQVISSKSGDREGLEVAACDSETKAMDSMSQM
jgi:hypothetical protein